MSTRHGARFARLVSPIVACLGLPAGAALTLQCAVDPATTRASCAEDADCAAGATCLADLSSDTSYCSMLCASDLGCAPYQSCVPVVAFKEDSTPTRVCVDRVRTCLEGEHCNGLDDDCDGVVDGAGCLPVFGCLSDRTCGTFVCQALAPQRETICAPAVSSPIADFSTCTGAADCRNATCSTGLCAPLCNPSDRGLLGCPTGFSCVQAATGPNFPAHNVCQKTCRVPADCPSPQVCAWRTVFGSLPDLHDLVCTTPGPGRKSLGEPCSATTTSGDDECGHGLCFENRCTRSCAGTASDCSDVGPELVCNDDYTLSYGLREFALEICSERR